MKKTLIAVLAAVLLVGSFNGGAFAAAPGRFAAQQASERNHRPEPPRQRRRPQPGRPGQHHRPQQHHNNRHRNRHDSSKVVWGVVAGAMIGAAIAHAAR